MKTILAGVNYFAGWWEPLPNKWHRHADSFAIEQGEDWRPEFPERVPLLGEFNNQETLNKELVVAGDYGVDFFPILWYYNEKDAEREPHSSLLNNIFDDYLNSPNADRVNFFIEFCNHPPFDVTEDWQWQECLDAWEKIITHPSYLKVGGKALFKVHGADYFIQQNNNDIARCKKQLDSIRELFRSKGMEVIIGAGVMTEQHIDADNPIAHVFDFTCTYMDFPNLEPKDTDYPYDLLGEHCRLARQIHSKDAIPYMPYMPAGWSPRPWPDTRACFDFPTREEWRKELELMRNDLLTLPNLGLPLADGSIQAAFNSYAWNEFGEGGIIAPTHITEYMKLEEWSAIFKAEQVHNEHDLIFN
ncbi:hypothetical protein LNTAR_06779 [Lentisphaera araneosa HTCC2155]|jgi:hypothetical protein|uniref:Uncharacterized protein n=1 Tax=Lentisphaera araneosa HTCC2155 TaxID=313628 RepID=A6DNI2_9BACT|nr:hypothetical protein [Lentisphaera araneosa]EDM26930.1 hypothetical protein LNTAR_06779 [Lentisphaera araneosa HTCC2155]